jgi:hypothetical protein
MEMTTDFFERGFLADRYVEGLRNYRSLVKGLMVSVQTLQIEPLPKQYDLQATISTEDWCGDSACVVPVIDRFCAINQIPLRIFRGSETAGLKDFYEGSGTDHIPVLSFWSKSGAEVVRWVESPAAVQEQKRTWKAARPEFMELYNRRADGDEEAAREFGKLYRLFLDEMASWYREGLWNAVVEELTAAVENGASVNQE